MRASRFECPGHTAPGSCGNAVMTLPTATKLSPSEIDPRLADPRIDDILARLDAPGGATTASSKR